MDKPCGHYAKWNKLNTKDKYGIIPPMWVIYKVTELKQKTEWWLAGGAWRGKRGVFIQWVGLASVMQDEKNSRDPVHNS